MRDYANALWLDAKDKVDDLLCDYNCATSDFGWDYELFLGIGRIIDRFENTLFNNDYSLGCIIEVCKKNLQGVQNSQAYFKSGRNNLNIKQASLKNLCTFLIK